MSRRNLAPGSNYHTADWRFPLSTFIVNVVGYLRLLIGHSLATTLRYLLASVLCLSSESIFNPYRVPSSRYPAGAKCR